MCAERMLHERAWTMIEMLIGMVLLAIAMAVVIGAIVQAVSGSTGARTGAISDAALSRTSDALSDDIARATTPDHADNVVRDPNDLARGVRNGTDISTSAQGAPMIANLDEVVIADTSTLRLIVGTRCVTWRAATAAKFTLTRSETAATNCDAPATPKQYISAVPTAPGLDTTPFSYSLVCNATLCPGSSADASAPCKASVFGDTPSEVRVPDQQRRWVTGVQASIMSVVTESKSTASTQGSISQRIGVRDVENYRTALGC